MSIMVKAEPVPCPSPEQQALDRRVYPESDGNPISDHTLQFEWIVTIEGGLEALFADDPDVFVAGDLLWYPVEGDPKMRIAPDAMVVFGRPKGQRGSYLQWREENIPPQVVFEVLSPGNRLGEMLRKLEIYGRFGVEEYYLYDPFRLDLTGWLRSSEDNQLRLIEPISGWVSPRLGVRFELPEDGELILYRPDGERFRTYVELANLRERAEQERERAEQERDRLAARLRELGIDPDAA